jgi:outer membrane protein OmpA-like peptidoglycan-associated protein
MVSRKTSHLLRICVAMVLSAIFCAFGGRCLAQPEDPCKRNVSEQTKLLNGCPEPGGGSPPARTHAPDEEVRNFLLQLADQLRPITPPPYDSFDREKLVHHYKARNAHYLILPNSHSRYDTSVSNISTRLSAVLPSVRTFLQAHPNMTVELEVHTTDYRPSETERSDPCLSDNSALTECRAQNINRFLMSETPPADITVVSKGDSASECFKRGTCLDSLATYDRQIRLVVVLRRQ